MRVAEASFLPSKVLSNRIKNMQYFFFTQAGRKSKLFGTSLCRVGPEHRGKAWGAAQLQCAFCHSLTELRQCPMHFSTQYRNRRCDRFVGQELSTEQEHKFKLYYDAAKPWDIPAWAHGCYWHLRDLDLLWKAELGWDFGLSCEELALSWHNLDDIKVDAFFDRLRQRKLAFERLND